MKIGLIADTHIPSMGAEPPSQVVRAFEGVDLILHAGHVEIAPCIKWLERIAPVTATTSWLVGTGEALPRANTVKVVEAENHTKSARSIIRAALLFGVISRMATVPSLMFCFTKLGLPGLTKSTPW